MTREGAILMAIHSINLSNRNSLAAKYVKGELEQFFPYDPFNETEERVNDLQKRTFHREELTSVLKKMNEDWDASAETLAQIERLRDEKSVVVIGGQQAGLLTGPLYTIHKLISIIKYAKEQEEKLNIPVIPVFWIAGEDHDYDEINHVFTATQSGLNKRVISQEEWRKKSITHIPLNKDLTKQWIKEVFYDLVETTYTKNLSETIFNIVEQSETFVDFFARFIFQLFGSEGIVLIDSADENLRHIESEVFTQLIERQEYIAEAIFNTSQKVHYEGYSVQVDVSEHDGNLFYRDHNDERILLIKKNSKWVGKHDEVSFTTDELLDIAKNNPSRLSNNVMTRPLMQETLFPTLAFVAGDGEISYWALLKDAFTAFDLNITMPPILPRLSMTLVTERIYKLMASRNLDPAYIVNNGCSKLKMNWLSTQQNPPINLLFDQAETDIKDIHTSIQTLATSIGPDLGAEAERNLDNILRELHYMKNRTIQQLQQKYVQQLSKFQEVQLALRPNEQLQERVHNIISILNECGFSFIKEILEREIPFTKDHHLIYMHRLKGD